MEGVYRGVGMDRVLFALSTPDKKGIRAKFALGQDNEVLSHSFNFGRMPNQRNIFFEVLDQGECLLVDLQKRAEQAVMVNSAVTSVIGKRPFILSAITINGKSIGVLYADRSLSGRELDEESQESFCHFAKQANMGLSLIASRR